MTNYEKFKALHHGANPLIIANAWNVKSAQLIEKAGFDAMATSSGAISESLGYPDGEKIPFSELLYIIKRISVSISIPLSVDLERGYTDDLAELNNHIQQLIDIGVVGINLEDAQGEEIYLKKLSSIKRYLQSTNQQLFINARCDAFLQKLDTPLERTINRAKLYAEAGADSFFVTGIQDLSVIKEIASAVTLPLNIVNGPQVSIQSLTESGVKRISMAVLLYKATYKQLEKMVADIRSANSFAALF